MTDDKGRRSLPPYVSYRTFRNFADGLQLGIPSRIDRSYWGDRYSGSTGTQLMTALRFLGLIDSDGIPQTRLRQLVSAKGAQRSEVLKQIAYSAFDFLSDRSLDPEVATYAQLEKAFYNSYQVTGDVTRKCIKFLISLESDAGVPPASGLIPSENTWYEMVLVKFPTFDPVWPDDVKLKWFEAFATLLNRGSVSDTEK